MYYRLVNFDKYQSAEDKRAGSRSGRHHWFRVSCDVFRDIKIASLSASEQIGWFALLVVAKLTNNKIPDDVKAIRRMSCVGNRIIIDLGKLVKLGLIEFVSDEQVQLKLVGSEPVKKRKKPVSEDVNTNEARAIIDKINEILGIKLGYTDGWLKRANKIIDGGYSESIIDVLHALNGKLTETAKWAREAKKLDWALRPGENGGLDKIILELQLKAKKEPVKEVKRSTVQEDQEAILRETERLEKLFG